MGVVASNISLGSGVLLIGRDAKAVESSLGVTNVVNMPRFSTSCPGQVGYIQRSFNIEGTVLFGQQ